MTKPLNESAVREVEGASATGTRGSPLIDRNNMER